MTEYTAEMATAAVARGAAWLDAQCPNWAYEINLDTLDLHEADVCILGQTADCLVGPANPDDMEPDQGYFRVLAVEVSGGCIAEEDWAIEHGFNVMSAETNRADYEMLTIAWKGLIRERLAAEVPS